MFFFKKIKYLTIIIFFFLFLILTFLALSNENRRSIISKGLVLHDFYRIKSLTYGLQIRDFSLLSKKLDTYIEFSKKFSAGNYGVSCALIIGKRKESTNKKTSLNEALREYNVAI